MGWLDTAAVGSTPAFSFSESHKNMIYNEHLLLSANFVFVPFAIAIEYHDVALHYLAPTRALLQDTSNIPRTLTDHSLCHITKGNVWTNRAPHVSDNLTWHDKIEKINYQAEGGQILQNERQNKNEKPTS